MRAELDENGVMAIIAESPIEAYAITKWFNFKGDGKLHIITDAEEWEDPEPTALKCCFHDTDAGVF